MLQESNCFQKIYIACGKTDLRKGIDGLAELVKHQFQLEPYQKNVLFLFCLFLRFLFYIEISLAYNAGLVSGIQ